MKKIIARFLCHEVTRGINFEMVKLNPVYSPDKSHPNYSWCQATPSGKIEMTITNRLALGAFVPGIEYDIAFIPRRPEEQAPPS